MKFVRDLLAEGNSIGNGLSTGACGAVIEYRCCYFRRRRPPCRYVGLRLSVHESLQHQRRKLS